jgi:Glycine-zipper domain
MRRLPSIALLSTLALGACTVAPPTGPSAMALPGKDKTFDAFQQDDATCRQYASAQIGGAAPADAANQSLIGSAAVGTVIGAAAGAALGAAAGNPALGAAAGAGAGLLGGTAVGANAASASGASMQQRFDMAYMQCMYGHGNSVPSQPTAASAYPYPYAGYAYPAYPGYYYPYPSGYVGVGVGCCWGRHHW